MESPYKNQPVSNWTRITERLIKEHPLSTKEIVEVTLNEWNEIFATKIGTQPFYIGKDIFPKPQIMGFLLHELIPLEFQTRHPKLLQKEKTSHDKDLVCITDDKFSIEIKTSSNPNSIFGNRSYAQEAASDKKSKSGYYLAINFEKFSDEIDHPEILKIRFGWLDHSDWLGQKAATGQQSRLSKEVESYKLFQLYSRK